MRFSDVLIFSLVITETDGRNFINTPSLEASSENCECVNTSTHEGVDFCTRQAAMPNVDTPKVHACRRGQNSSLFIMQENLFVRRTCKESAPSQNLELWCM